MNNNYAITSTSYTKENANQYIVFELKNNLYAINIQSVIEVINIPQIEIPQTMPTGIIGVFNYNGEIIKVVDLCPLLGFEPNQFTINNQLIIICEQGIYYAIHAEKIINIIQADYTKIQCLPYNTELSILKEIYKANENTINIINIEQIEKIIKINVEKVNNINYLSLFPNDEKSKQILQLRAEQNKKIQELFAFPVSSNSVNQYILFELDGQNYYLDLKYIKEFISLKRINITKLPYTQDFIKGIINLKGDFLVVLDLKKFLNNDREGAKEGTKLIIVESKNFNLALMVDDIKLIRNLKDIEYTDTNISNSSPYITSEFMEGNELYSILNFEKIINDERIYINIK